MHNATADTTSPILIGEHGTLQDHHRRALHARGLSDEMIESAGYYTEFNVRRLAYALGWKEPAAGRLGPCLAIPYVDADGRNGYVRFRPDVPRKDSKGKAIKYESPKGQPNRLYLPPGVHDRLDDPGAELLITEGEFKAAAATQRGYRCLGLVGVLGWKRKDEAALLPELERIAWQGRNVFIVFDSDVATNPNVQKALAWLCHHLKTRDANVRVVYLPSGPNDEKVGLDDYLVAHGPGELRKLLDNAEEPPDVPSDIVKQHSEQADPATEAAAILKASQVDGVPALRFWRGSFWFYANGCYREVLNSEVEGIVTKHLNAGFFKVGTSIVRNVMLQLRSQGMIPGFKIPPCWIDGNGADGSELLVCKNGILHLPSFVADVPGYLKPATPRLFSTTALDYDFPAEDPGCDQWLQFLAQLWRDDQQSIDTLQEWFGYCLVPWTSLQKILLLIGPKRSGKGTLNRILRGVIGEANCCSPTLASLGSHFGLWALLGKTLATISDARLSGRTDHAVVVERLLSISGEDHQTIDRKNLEAITTKLLARFVIISNELPRLQDSSGALTGRFVTLRLEESFYGREDTGLTERLMQERPGILRWAIDGWRRLKERGYFQQPESSASLREQMEDLASPIGAFLRDCCVVDDSYFAKVDSVFEAWKAWCEKAGREPGTIQSFGRDLLAAIPRLRVVRPNEDGKRFRVYEGIGLRAD